MKRKVIIFVSLNVTAEYYANVSGHILGERKENYYETQNINSKLILNILPFSFDFLTKYCQEGEANKTRRLRKKKTTH